MAAFLVLLLAAVLCAALASCTSDGERSAATAGPETRASQPTTTVRPSTASIPSATVVGQRVCSTIWASTDGAWTLRPDHVALGPVVLTALLDGSQTAAPRTMLADGVTVLTTKNPLTIHETPASTVRVSVSDPHDAARVLYDDAGLQAFARQEYRFADGATAVELPGPVPCGQGAGGLVQYNGGFVVREPTCVTITVSVDGVAVGHRDVAFAGGRCARPTGSR